MSDPLSSFPVSIHHPFFLSPLVSFFSYHVTSESLNNIHSYHGMYLPKFIQNKILWSTPISQIEQCTTTLIKYQRLPWACNRSPRSKLLPFLFLSNIMCKCPRLFSMICCFLRNTHKKMSRLFSMICYFPRKKKEKNSTTMIFSNRKTYLSNMCPTPCYMCELSIDRIWLWMRILWAYMIEQELV